MSADLVLGTRDISGFGLLISEPSRARQTFLADGAITKGLAVYVSKAGYVKVGKAGFKAIGIAETTAADGAPVTVLVAKGARVTAKSADAITAGTHLYVKADNAGKVVGVAASAITAASVTTTTVADPTKIATIVNAALEENRCLFAIPLTTVDAADKEVEIILI